MAVYRQFILTRQGRELINKAVGGLAHIQITSIKTSSTIYEEKDLPNLTDIGEIKQSVSVSVHMPAGKTNLRLFARFTNEDIPAGYFVRNFGIYAKNLDEEDSEEILYGVVNADESEYPCSSIPAFNGIGRSGIDFDTIIDVDDCENITVVIDPGNTVSNKAFEMHIEEFNALAETFESHVKTFETHENTSIPSAAGAHGLRYYNEEFQRYNAETKEWESTGAGIKKTALTLRASAWTAVSGIADLFQQNITQEDITSNVKANKTSFDCFTDIATKRALQEQEVNIIWIENKNGTAVAFAEGAKPTSDIQLQVRILN